MQTRLKSNTQPAQPTPWSKCSTNLWRRAHLVTRSTVLTLGSPLLQGLGTQISSALLTWLRQKLHAWLGGQRACPAHAVMHTQ